MRPVEVHIDNIASCKKARDYRPLREIAGFPKIIAEGSSQPHGHAKSSSTPASSLSRLAQQSMSSQSQALEDVYNMMLREITDLDALAKVEEADLKAFQREVDSLQATLG